MQDLQCHVNTSSKTKERQNELPLAKKRNVIKKYENQAKVTDCMYVSNLARLEDRP